MQIVQKIQFWIFLLPDHIFMLLLSIINKVVQTLDQLPHFNKNKTQIEAEN